MDKMDNKKLITWGVVIVGGLLVYKYVLKGKGNSNSGGGGGTTPAGGGGLLSASAIKKMADDIYEAMDGYGTDEDTIVSAFQRIKTDADFDALVQAYGTRSVSSGAGNIFMSDYNGDLSGALHDELSSGWITDINNALQRNGVNRSV